MAVYQGSGRSNYVMSFGEGRPVLLLHGIINSGRAWAPQIPALVAAGYRVIVPDHAGHGASAGCPPPTRAVFKAGLRARNAACEQAFAASHAQFDLITSHFVTPASDEGFDVVVHR